jgi:hypothetical protein
MEIAIVKDTGSAHRAVVVRGDRSTARFAVADYGDRLPHDLVHYVVEDELRLGWGFWGLVALGAELHALRTYRALNRRALPQRSDPLVAAHTDDLVHAERMVAELYDLWGAGDRDGGLDHDRAEHIRERIDDLNARWQALAPGQALRLAWDLEEG